MESQQYMYDMYRYISLWPHLVMKLKITRLHYYPTSPYQ